MLSVGLLIIRLIIGLLFVGHGAQKLFGWFGGHGLKGTGGWFESIGMKPGVTVALLAGLSELFGGIMFALGLLTPPCRNHHCRNNGNGYCKSTWSKWTMGNKQWIRI
ncbi:putative membrane protein YphA (DoxX/SURF4 family) [Bacillus atrophaeus]|nr:putative membrane protein YphA (DoxX/SURF4 family) [Bacillus atrophaeus]